MPGSMRWGGSHPAARPARLGLLIALAGVVQALEAVLPSPVPWFRLGLGNAPVLVALCLGGVGEGAWVGFGKVLVGGLLSGRLLSPGFFLALGGTGAAVAAMGAALRLPGRLGLVGVSALGAQAHALAQLAVAGALLRTPAVWSLAPLLGLLSVASGALTGLAAHALARSLSPAARAPDRGRPQKG